jgi:hypothetical protein
MKVGLSFETIFVSELRFRVNFRRMSRFVEVHRGPKGFIGMSPDSGDLTAVWVLGPSHLHVQWASLLAPHYFTQCKIVGGQLHQSSRSLLHHVCLAKEQVLSYSPTSVLKSGPVQFFGSKRGQPGPDRLH